MTEPLVLIPGMACDARLFEAQIRALGRDRPVTIALPTQGERIEEIASNLLTQLPSKFALLGLSMGGCLAMEILRHAPDRVQRLALLSTTPLADTPQQSAAREPLIVKLRSGKLDEALREALPPSAFAAGPGRFEAINLFLAMGAELGPALIERQIRALQRRRDQQATLRRLKVPTLVLCGAEDDLSPVKRHEFMADLIPQSHLAVIDGAGHLPSIEQPEAVTEELRRWLRQPYLLK
ncbi:alpha/beta fold hydrolase [Pseudooceanicola sp.]|uniref:alpha/beta fold hydrolase n=1 Tax=Pseudooceanicola sp. TaxID=1914328 RepID=UPI0026308B24|nr:alpha/beta fold hydrolase [Pseudooceanicola sp.]MDF1854006.1 alpha/beta fold hydrolase [Pseudooceanicola sp.]